MVDQPVPDFTLPATGNQTFSLSPARGSALVLYFYPKDNTPGCTTEAGEFRELHARFRRAGCAVYGISRDSLKSHEGFKAKLRLPFELLSDADETACALFGVIRQKVLYGKPVRGIERSTFVIDAEGVLRREWRGVKAPGHAAEVLEFVQSLKRDK
ncbi:MAG: peroxiredoxin [Rhodocyclaceae bacterium]|nr:peroxiredoxin [Rhodocyclaceae bacterium]MCC6879623.1 peroxiredoxin [Rhodocyclaceae bacterium]MCL4679864.1 peroxiredoxin [Rhodocyclaceae bacterium]